VQGAENVNDITFSLHREARGHFIADLNITKLNTVVREYNKIRELN